MNVSCYLLRRSRRPSDLIRPTEADVRCYRVVDDRLWEIVDSVEEAQSQSQGIGVLYRTTAQEPSHWQSMVGMWEEAIDRSADDFPIEGRQDRGAIFFFQVGDPARWLAWSFGRGFQYLIRSNLDPRFGVISALNSLTEGEGAAAFRKLQVRRQVGVPQIVGRATFGDAPIGAFELDEVWDAIKSIGGRTADGTSVYGGLSLVESRLVIAPDDLRQLSENSLHRFAETHYSSNSVSSTSTFRSQTKL